ncbi:MAG: peptide deformylase [Oscillospiraceae bacterium]|nr:peptide deformylase [Oscillospiraceae bacterium]
MVREIVTDPIFLKMKSEPADRSDTELIKDLTDTLKANSYRCAGLAANMIGVRKTVLAAAVGKKQLIMINPVIVDRSKAVYTAEEGCLSHVGTHTVKRHRVITVEYLDARFKRKKETFKDFEAQIIQHEMDHFQGILV